MKLQIAERQPTKRRRAAVPLRVAPAEVLAEDAPPAGYAVARIAARLAMMPRARLMPISTIANDAIALEAAATEIRAGQIGASAAAARAREILVPYGADLVIDAAPGVWMGTASHGFSDRYLLA